MPITTVVKFTPHLQGITRCPHCGISSPTLHFVYGNSADAKNAYRADGGMSYCWVAYRCQSCNGHVLAKSRETFGQVSVPDMTVGKIIPDVKTAAEELPLRARSYLNQAYETLNSPDAAAMVAGSAVDAMLKDKGYTEGSVYTRIDKAKEDNLLTEAMADWAHEVRLGSNRPRHADAENPHVTPEEAKQSVEFAEALGQFLYVITSRIHRGIKAAKGETDG